MDRRLTGRHVVFGLGAFFGVVFFADGLMMWQAARTYDGLASEDPYRKGRDYNAEISAARTQAALGWRTELADMSPQGTTLRVTDGEGRPLDGLDIAGRFLSPVDAAEDRRFRARPLGGGSYRLSADLPRPGNWRLEVMAVDGAGAGMRIERSLMVPRAAN